MRRLMYLTAVTVGLCVAGTGTAQPRPGGPDRGRPDGSDLRRLEARLEQLTAKLDELDARLARMQRAPDPKDGSRSERPDDRGRDRPRFAGPGGDRPGFGGGRGPGPGGMGFGRFGPDGLRGPGGGPGGRGPGGPGGPGRPGAGESPDVARRIDRIINELEELKKELQGPRR